MVNNKEIITNGINFPKTLTVIFFIFITNRLVFVLVYLHKIPNEMPCFHIINYTNCGLSILLGNEIKLFYKNINLYINTREMASCYVPTCFSRCPNDSKIPLYIIGIPVYTLKIYI